MEPEYTFETEYNLTTLSAMSKAIRKTIRKKSSRRAHIFGVFAVLLGLFDTFVLSPDVLTIAAVILILLALLFEDRINGFVAQKRLLSGTEHCKSEFCRDLFVSTTAIGKTEFYYDRIEFLAENTDFFIFIFSRSHAQAYDKKSLSGGTPDDFRVFIEDVTGKKMVWV